MDSCPASSTFLPDSLGKRKALRALFARLSAGVTLLVSSPAWAADAPISPRDIHPERELLITAPGVLESEEAKYPGAWSFGGLVEALVGPENASACVHDWLETWNGTQNINGHEVPPRYGIVEKVIKPWQKRDGYQPADNKPWEPQLSHAPFRLLAIVNRIDLCAPAVAGTLKEVQDAWKAHGKEQQFLTLLSFGEQQTAPNSGQTSFSGYGFSSRPVTAQEEPLATFGEGRMVFGATDEDGAPLEGGWTVILEYNLTASAGLTTVREWADAWHQLGSLDLNKPEFALALARVTRCFTHGRSASLGQLRSSEAAFGAGREFRQFARGERQFEPVSLTQTPIADFGVKHSPEQKVMSEFLHAEDALFRSGIDLLPAKLPVGRRGEVNVLAGSATIPADEPNFYWDMTSLVSRQTRHLFSLNTCTGCHAGETGCAEGLHIHPRAEGMEAKISNFLRTDGQSVRVSDPDVKGSRLDYQEMADRAAILAALLKPHDRSAIIALRPILRARLARAH